MSRLSRAEPAPQSLHQHRWVGWLAAVLGVLAALLWLQWARPAWWAPIRAEDINQPRLDMAPAPPRRDAPLQQSFVPMHEGLEVVEITLARAGAGNGSGGTLALVLFDDTGASIAREQWNNQQLRHNQTLQLSFAPQPHSRGKRYTLAIQGNDANVFSVWAYQIDVYGDGALEGGDRAADLQFTTRYRLLRASAVHALAALVRESGALLMLLGFLLVLPGSVLLLLVGHCVPRLDPAAWLALAMVLGAAFWPLLWQWTTLTGARWRQGSLLALLIALALLAVLLAWRRRPQIGPLRRQHLLLSLLLLAGLVVRLLAVRDLAFPPWVDSSRHALITRIMTERGQMLEDYYPYLPVARALYHYGFHTIAASLNMLGGWPLPRLLLFAGQGLGAAVPLALYGAAWMVTRRREAALFAAFLVAFPFYFPAYYATWGRFTQLTGVLVLAVLLALTWQLERGARGWRAGWPLMALLAAGLALIHFRVFLLYLLFVPLVLLAARGRAARTLAAAALLGALAAAPYLVRLGLQTAPSGIFSTPPASYASFPTGYLTIGWERAFWWLAGLAWLSALVATARGRPWARLPLVLAAWLAAMVLAFSGAIPNTWLINLNSAYIVFFLPVALLLAIAAPPILRTVPREGLARALYTAAGVFVLTVALLFGTRQQMTIINSETILARPADSEALDWADGHLPAGAKIAINAWQWLGRTWAGNDGGAWLLPLTGIATTTPPVDYTNSRALVLEVDAFNQGATDVDDWSAPAATAWLRDQGVTHIFAGARGGFFEPSALLRNSTLCQLYARDGVFIFGLRAAGRDICPP